MFDNNREKIVTEVLNPLNATKSSLIEFNIGELKDTGLYRFKKIIQFNVGDKMYTRYLLYTNLEEKECILEAFPGYNQQLETFLYTLADTVPFSEDFLGIVGQRFLNTPDGLEYQRCIMPEAEEHLDGLRGRVKVFNLETGKIEKEMGVTLWDYQRDEDGRTQFLNIEMTEDVGMFRIFNGEMIESIFYRFYQTSKEG